MFAPTRRLFALAACGLLLTAALPASAWNWNWGKGERVRGNGEVVTEARSLGDFDAISLHGDLNAVVRQAGSVKVELRADKNLLPYLETRVVDGAKGRTLEIGPKRGYDPVGTVPLTVSVDLPSLRAVSIAGSGKVRVEAFKASGRFDGSIAGSGDLQLDGLQADQVFLSIAGSGDVVATGRASELQASIAGSGDVKALGLATNEAKISISGSGDAQVQVAQKLKVSIAGSGDVRYLGSPEVSSSVAGSGSVRRAKD